MGAAAGVDRDLHFAFGTLLGRGIGRGRSFAHPRDQGVDGRHYKKVNRCGDQQKRDGRVDEVSDRKQRAVNGEADGGEVGLTGDRGDERREQVFGEGSDYRSESSSDDHADCHIHYIATENELLESAEHGGLPRANGAFALRLDASAYGHRIMRSEDHKHTSPSLRLSFKVAIDHEAKWLPKSKLA